MNAVAAAALSDSEFSKFQRVIEQEIGIHLSDAKRSLLQSRLGRRLRQLGIESYGDYFDLVMKGDAQERSLMFDAICTNETSFFREAPHFELLRSQIVPRWRSDAAAGLRAKRIRIWSAACSTGEEPYSLAMLLLDELGGAGWDLAIDATDVSTRALEHSRRGVWPSSKASSIPESYLRRYMLRGTRARSGTVQAGDQVRSILRFGRLNLVQDSYPFGEYDAVFCRNVLIYFTAALRTAVVQRLLRHLAGGGYFFVGHAETLVGVTESVRTVIPTVYVR